MRKNVLFLISLAVIAVATVIVTNTYSSEDRLLKENIKALAGGGTIPEGGPCEFDAECADGLVCVFGKCTLGEDGSGGGGSELCWKWGIEDNYKTLRVCNTSTNTCYTQYKTTNPATGGSMIFCPY